MILEQLSPSQQSYFLIKELIDRGKRRKIFSYYPETGDLRRELYVKHLSYFRLGKTHKERCMLAANRVGKTETVGGYELVMHLTGLYPDWWEGYRFDKQINAWAAGDTSKTVRDIIQFKLLGETGSHGTGLIPGELIQRITTKQGIADAVEDIYVKHVSGGVSRVTLKSYDQRREAFQGTEQKVIWLDEEPPLDIYTECLTRLMTTNGLMMCTFTPLMGISDVVKLFLPTGDASDRLDGHRAVVMATWDDAPHLSKDQKEMLWSSIPPYQRDARSKGIPQLGSGAIYPVPESEIVVAPFEIPDYWPRVYGLDVGWNRTACIWAAIDRDSGSIYLYSEHYQGHAEPSIHASAIQARGKWINGVIDPAARGRSQIDGDQLLQNYRDLGLNIRKADNTVEAGIYNVWQGLSSGRIKVFNTLRSWLSEFRIYRRDEKGKIIKQDDHLMDATRYLIMTGLDIADIDRSNETNYYEKIERRVVDGWD